MVYHVIDLSLHMKSGRICFLLQHINTLLQDSSYLTSVSVIPANKIILLNEHNNDDNNLLLWFIGVSIG